MGATPSPPDSPHAGQLTVLIEQRRARVCVVGLGYVGLPLLSAVAGAGYPAIGLDHDREKIEALRQGRNYLPHLGREMTQALAANPGVTLSDDPAVLRDADAVLVCVPTPLTAANEPDLSAVERAAEEIRRFALAADPGRPRLVVLESTTYPGTTRDVLSRILGGGPSAPLHSTAHSPLPTPLFIAFSPEREDPGNRDFSTRTIPKLVGGVDEASGQLASALYERIVQKVVRVRNAEVAEAAKLVENIYRSVNIALVNELKIVLHAMGLDIWEVLDAAQTKPFGFHRFNPGPGFGGHCVPVDPHYLAWKARQAGQRTAFVELAGEINRRMPAWVVERCGAALQSQGRTLRGARVLVLGLAYKPDIADVRESPSFELIELFKEAGSEVSYHDPHVPRTWRGRRHDVKMESIAWSAAAVAAQDVVVIATDHSWYDWKMVATHARLVVDSRGAMRRAGVSGPAQVVPA